MEEVENGNADGKTGGLEEQTLPFFLFTAK